MYPYPHQYVTCFPRFVTALAGKAFEHGSADALGGCPAVALWLPPSVQPDEQAIGELVQQTVSEDLRGDMFAFFEQMGRFHPAEPHWYLPLIGVDPVRQGEGRGAELMKQRLARCDSDHMLAYLEATNSRNLSLYERLGFERLGTIQAGSSPSMYPMARKPR
jgi:ribosomal protein S18 acetylase RimI-like enzyme